MHNLCKRDIIMKLKVIRYKGVTNKMARNIVIKEEQNPEKNFYRVRQDLLRIANDRGVEVTEVIDSFIEDLQNLLLLLFLTNKYFL